MAKRVENRARQQNYQARKLAAGLCPRCGNEARDMNTKTGKPYHYGHRCRALANEETAARMRVRRATGKA